MAHLARPLRKLLDAIAEDMHLVLDRPTRPPARLHSVT
jgi:hypothetical protein